MRAIDLVVAALTAIGCMAIAGQQPPADEAELEERFASLPPDARAIAQRAVLCAHFGSEINGDGGQRDQQVYRRMVELACETVEDEVAAMRIRYARHPQILAVLAQVGGW